MAPNHRPDDIVDPQDLNAADLAVVVELQRTELDRLLRENAQLHARVSQLISLQEREQVLRQQLQTMMGGPNKAAPVKLREDNSELAERAQSAQARYERLKGALTLLITAIERQKQPEAVPVED